MSSGRTLLCRGSSGQAAGHLYILTRPAADALEHIHDRTPVIVPQGLQSDWLDSKTTAKADVAGLLDALWSDSPGRE